MIWPESVSIIYHPFNPFLTVGHRIPNYLEFVKAEFKHLELLFNQLYSDSLSDVEPGP